jgi:hypothetical protein
MTTIAFRDGIMAADTMMSQSVYRGRCLKITRTGAGDLVALCGDSGMAHPFAAWIDAGLPRDGLPRMPTGTDFGAFVAFADGRFAVFSEKCLPQFVEAEFHAMGSGNEVAIGAMAMGASAEEAVKIACQFDPWSREPIQVEHLKLRL